MRGFSLRKATAKTPVAISYRLKALISGNIKLPPPPPGSVAQLRTRFCLPFLAIMCDPMRMCILCGLTFSLFFTTRMGQARRVERSKMRKEKEAERRRFEEARAKR